MHFSLLRIKSLIFGGLTKIAWPRHVYKVSIVLHGQSLLICNLSHSEPAIRKSSLMKIGTEYDDA